MTRDRIHSLTTVSSVVRSQVPMAEESGDDGVLECEAIRNVLVSAGISPHHIIMDCSAVRSHSFLPSLHATSHCAT